MNEIEPLTSLDDVASPQPPVNRAASAEHAITAPLPHAPTQEPAPASPTRSAQEPTQEAYAGNVTPLRRDRLWRFVKAKAEDIFDRLSFADPGAADPAPSRDQPSPSPEQEWSAVARPQAAEGLPESLHKRYFIAENKFYFRDREQALAFEDRGTRLVTIHNDPEIARSMVELAQAKDWTTLRLKGTDEFKREAWLAASLRGLDVRGYRPTELDKARLAAEIDRPQRANVIEPGREQGPEPASAQDGRQRSDGPPAQEPEPTAPNMRQTAIQTLERLLRARGDSEQAIDMTTQIAADQLQQRRVYVGKLLDHGPARFDNKPINEHSYFVVLDTGSEEKTLWGVDLARAVASSGAQRGDDIVIAQPDSRQVTVPQLVRDSTGHATGEKIFINAKRNDWVIRTVDGLRDDAKERPQEHPQPAQETVQRPLRANPTSEKSAPPRTYDHDDRDRATDRTPFER